jgi:hypothetical protein
MHSHDFSGCRDFETLGGAPMRFQLELLYLFCHKHLPRWISSGAGPASSPLEFKMSNRSR